MVISWYVVVCFIVLSLEQDIPLASEGSASIDENTKLVIFGMGHGNRHPGKFVEYSRNWGFEGAYELTQVCYLIMLISLKHMMIYMNLSGDLDS